MGNHFSTDLCTNLWKSSCLLTHDGGTRNGVCAPNFRALGPEVATRGEERDAEEICGRRRTVRGGGLDNPGRRGRRSLRRRGAVGQSVAVGLHDLRYRHPRSRPDLRNLRLRVRSYPHLYVVGMQRFDHIRGQRPGQVTALHPAPERMVGLFVPLRLRLRLHRLDDRQRLEPAGVHQRRVPQPHPTRRLDHRQRVPAQITGRWPPPTPATDERTTP